MCTEMQSKVNIRRFVPTAIVVGSQILERTSRIDEQRQHEFHDGNSS
jgi:hypothetical protein